MGQKFYITQVPSTYQHRKDQGSSLDMLKDRGAVV